MIILGIDPGTNRVGYGVLNNGSHIGHGCVEVESKKDAKDYLSIFDAVDSLIKKHKPDVLAIEKIFFFKNQKTVIQVSQARGIIVLAGLKNNLKVREFTPLQVKQAVSSYGRAQKKEVQKMVRLILGLKEDPKPDDAADALAVAICCANTSEF